MFIDSSVKLSKYPIYSCENIPIQVKSHDKLTEQRFNLTIEKHKTINLMHIRLSCVNDKTMIFLCSVDDARFEQFKIDQSLHVTFEYFVKHITQMFDDYRANRMHLMVIANADGGHNERGQLQFYEKGKLKNLIHISLPIERAPIEVILHYVNESYTKLQEQNHLLAQTNNSLTMELQQRADQLSATEKLIDELKAEMNEQNKMQLNKQKEAIGRLEHEFKLVNESKDFQKQELEKQVTDFRARIDALVKENYATKEQHRTESKISAQLRNDNKKLSECVNELQTQMEQLKSDQMHRKNVTQKSDHIQQELRKQMQSLQDRVTVYEKQINELRAELDAEKNICQIKRNGLKMATEDICNANTIIRKQATEIASLKEKIDWRTEVALKQEQVICERGKVNDNITNLMQSLDASLKENAEQGQLTEHKLEWLTKQTDHLERKYEAKIDEIYNKLYSASSGDRQSASRRF